MTNRVALSLAICGLAAALPTRAIAQPDASASEAEKQDAKQHFDRGNELLEEGDSQAALAEFLRSRQLYPTRGNTLNAAVVLRKLGRYDESLEMFEHLTAEFSNLSAEELADVEREIAVLKTRIARLEIRTEDGATVYVDNRERGTTPLPAPLSVSEGSRVIRVVKPGRIPFERRIEIAGRQSMSLEIELRPLTEAGTAPAPAPPPPQRIIERVAIPGESRSRPFVALTAGALVTSSFGGQLRARCEDPCSASLPLGFGGFVSAGDALGSGFEVGAELGFLRLTGSYEDRSDPIRPVGWQGTGVARDNLTFYAIALGGNLAVRRGKSTPLTLGLSLGVLAASMRDQRRGVYPIRKIDGTTDTIDVAPDQTARGWYAYARPGVRVGFALSDRLELGLGLDLLLLVALSRPTWDGEAKLVSSVGLTYFEPDTLMGNVLLIAMPGVGARYVF